MMRTKLIAFLLISTFLISCGDETTVDPVELTEKESQKKEATENKIDEDENPLGLELNNGEKWKINEEMKPPLNSIIASIDDFVIAEPKNYKVLADKLHEDIALLISTCTMEGKSHDELHKWLVNFIDLADGLEKAENDRESGIIYVKIQESYAIFKEYFE